MTLFRQGTDKISYLQVSDVLGVLDSQSCDERISSSLGIPAAGDGALRQRAAAVVDFVIGRRQDGSVVVFGVLLSDIWRIIGFFCCSAVVSTVTPFL